MILEMYQVLKNEKPEDEIDVVDEARRGGRYATDYQELGAVGSGGFGHMYKVRNRLD